MARKKQKVDWIVVPDPDSNNTVATSLGGRVYEAEGYKFIPDGSDQEEEGYLLPDAVGYRLITDLKKKSGVSVRVFRKRGQEIKEINLELLGIKKEDEKTELERTREALEKI